MEVLQQLVDEGIPVVAVGDRSEDLGIGFVDADNVQGVQAAMGHLLGLGHRRIAMFCATMHSVDHMARLQAYKDELIRAGIGVDDRLIVPLIPIPCSMDAGYAMAQKFLADGIQATAIMCMADELAYGVLRALHEAGISVPERMSVVGFDGHRASAFMQPPLTTVRQPVARMGRRAAELVFAAIQSQSLFAGREIVPTELQLRQTVMPPAV